MFARRATAAARAPASSANPRTDTNITGDITVNNLVETISATIRSSGLQDQQEGQGRSAQALSARLELIESQQAENEKLLSKLLDLYLSGSFERDMLAERRVRLEENKEKLGEEHTDISSYLIQTVISDEQVEDIKSFCESIKDELDTATFDQKRQLPGMLNVRGTLAVENNERIVYVKCLVAPQQRLSLAQILPS